MTFLKFQENSCTKTFLKLILRLTIFSAQSPCKFPQVSKFLGPTRRRFFENVIQAGSTENFSKSDKFFIRNLFTHLAEAQNATLWMNGKSTYHYTFWV